MNKEKWNDIWNLMRSGRLKFDDKCNNKMFCIICKKMLINAHSGPCCCRYCLECITEYLNGEEKICPGKTVYCKHELLCINRNVHLDQPMNRKIIEIIVKCPHQNCNFETELINIEDHIRTCDSRSDECPYSNMGCKECNLLNTDETKKHMLMEIVPHTKLLFELIDNFKNEIKVMKEDKVELDKNNKDLMNCIIELKLKYENENKEIKEMLKETKNKCDEEKKNGVELRKEIKILNEEIKTLKKDTVENKKCINDLKLKCDNNNKEIKELKDLLMISDEEEKENAILMKKEIKMLNEENETLKKDTFENKKCIRDSKIKCENENKEIKEKIEKIENKFIGEQRETATKIDEINKIITDLKSISNERDKSISNEMNEMRVLQMIQEPMICEGGLVWRIDKWREKMEQARPNINPYIHSESFYSHRNGYKMCLSVWPNGALSGRGTHLSVSCCVMRGECDDILPWPFKHDVTFELINQHTTQIHTSSTVRYDDQYERGAAGDIYYDRDNRKPIEKDESNLICFNWKFISLEELSNNHSLIDNDRILIRCRVTIID